MNELIQALGNFTEALEQKIDSLEAKVNSLQEKLAIYNEQAIAQETTIADLKARILELETGLQAASMEKPQPEAEETPSEPEPIVAPDPEPVVEPEPEPEPVVEPEPEPEVAVESKPEPVIDPEPEAPEEQEPELFVTDIRKVISLGDRFLFQRELFGQNGEMMQRTLDIINQCATEQEALEYIEKNFDWDKKSPTYELFINAIRRSHSCR